LRVEAHTNGVNAARFSPTGELIASGTPGDGWLRFWSTEGRHLRDVPIEGGGASAIAFSPDGMTSDSAERRMV
jgi:WD40 repeat protein